MENRNGRKSHHHTDPALSDVEVAAPAADGRAASCALAAEHFDAPEQSRARDASKGVRRSVALGALALMLAVVVSGFGLSAAVGAPASECEVTAAGCPAKLWAVSAPDDCVAVLSKICIATPDVARMPPVEVEGVAEPTERRVVYRSDFARHSDRITPRSGEWELDGGALNQMKDCGFDLTALIETEVVEQFRLTVAMSAHGDGLGGGVVVNQSHPDTRSGAALVDFAEAGEFLRWGVYDEEGRYQYLGGVPIFGTSAGARRELVVEADGERARVLFGGIERGNFELLNVRGNVGLVTSNSSVAFHEVLLESEPLTVRPVR